MTPGSFTKHSRVCPKRKKRSAGALARVQELWASKRQRQDDSMPPEAQGVKTKTHTFGPLSSPLDAARVFDSASTTLYDLDRSVAERRTRRENRMLPKRYRDIIPAPAAALPPSSSLPHRRATSVTSITSRFNTKYCSISWDSPSTCLQVSSERVRVISRYQSNNFPQHDPEENVDREELMTASDEVLSSSEIDEQPYYPYPNQSSFTLHNWFWNDGVVKSQSSFRKLTKIISHPEFKPEDIARTNWQRIDARLADVEQDANISQRHEGRQYSDKWTETPITISVPFHAKMHRPGPQDFGAGILHHRKLVSVIREKVSNPESHPHFHYEPYELHWQPEGALEDVRVFGEMYTSRRSSMRTAIFS
ncbi:hypothetical protein A0H81_03259 [Grifola frondosa]|uniref:Uncharacterized protein n=1 Tax=Grifola frondosa TaxID=5627 RepID=A0A1C7MI24_GRIFR|nr:hypothetical protein A0H81_03259 [Grifola frondosa]